MEHDLLLIELVKLTERLALLAGRIATTASAIESATTIHRELTVLRVQLKKMVKP